MVELPEDMVEEPHDEAWTTWVDGQPQIQMRVYDERVLLHEVMHVIFKRSVGVIDEWIDSRRDVSDPQRAADRSFAAEEGIVRALTSALYGMGWRWKVEARHAAAEERDRLRGFAARETVLGELKAEAAHFHGAQEHPEPFNECSRDICGVYWRVTEKARV